MDEFSSFVVILHTLSRNVVAQNKNSTTSSLREWLIAIKVRLEKLIQT